MVDYALMEPYYSSVQSSRSSTVSSSSSPSKLSNVGCERNNVLNTGPWPMSQPTGIRASQRSLRASQRELKDCRSCRLSCSESHLGGRGRINRPLSMPPQNLYAADSVCGSSSASSYVGSSESETNGHSIELVTLGVDDVPLRNVSTERHSNPTPTCVPWLKKMKLLKKIQKKIGIGYRSGPLQTLDQQPLFFSNVHGENVQLSHNAAVAKRVNSFCKGIVFSGRPVKINEKICFRFAEISSVWSGVLRIGFSSVNPVYMKNSLPKYACPDLTSKDGFWARAFNDNHVKLDSIVYYYVNSTGDVHYGINGEDKGVFLTGIDTRGSLWALIDIYGNTTAIEFVEPNAHLNNSRGAGSTEEVPQAQFPIRHCEADNVSHISDRVNAMSLRKSRRHSQYGVHQIYPELIVGDIWFHNVTGRNAYVLPGMRVVASRINFEYCNAYVFSSRPLVPGELLVIQVELFDEIYSGSLTFGLTSCNPRTLKQDDLPDYCSSLYDRPEYWVLKKDAAINPKAGDIIAFEVATTGQVLVRKNKNPPRVLLHVDTSVPLWAFFELYGTTQKISLCGTVPPPEISAGPSRPLSNGNTTYSSNQNGTSHSLPVAVYEPIPVAKHQRDGCNIEASGSRNSDVKPSTTVTSNVSSTNVSQSNVKNNNKASSPGQSTSIQVNGSSPARCDESSDWAIECVACCECVVDSVFYPCGHMCMCYKCSMEYWKTKAKGLCPICRHVISDVIRTYKP